MYVSPMGKYKINKGFIIQKMGKETVIFDGEESVLYTFNETAAFIFGKLNKGLDEEEIAQALMTKYKIREKKAQKDTQELIRDLLAKKIIK